jgi:hypothetical protein
MNHWSNEMRGVHATYKGNKILELKEELPLHVGDEVSIVVLMEPTPAPPWRGMQAVSTSPAFDFLQYEAEDIYTPTDGQP